nr:hypothetical protein [Tanacetum cinerariifolium]
MSSLKAKQPKKPPPKRTRNIGKSKHAQLTTSSLFDSPPSDNEDLPSTKISPRTGNVGKSKHAQLTTSFTSHSSPSDNGDFPSTKLSPRFNTIITSLKELDESFLSRNHVRKFLRALPTKQNPKVVLEKDLEISKNKKEKYKSLTLKARKVLSEEEVTSSDSNDEEYAMAVRDFKKFFRRRGKFVRQPHDDKKNFQKVKEDKTEKDDQRCFKCGDPNHFISDCLKHSFSD